MKASIAVAGMLAVVFSGSVFSAKPPSKPVEKPKDLSLEKKIVEDGYFATGECEKYLSLSPSTEQLMIRRVSRLISLDDMIYFVSGKKSAVGDFEQLLTGTQYSLNPKLLEVKERLRKKPDLHLSYSDEIYSHEKAGAAADEWNAEFQKTKQDLKEPNAGRSYVLCEIVATATGVGAYSNHFESYAEYVESRVKEAEIGYFKISADSAYYGPSVNTGNRFAEPKKWDGSRFFVIRASFKNLDTESRLPSEGSLFINYKGKEYEFDSVEPVMLEGFNIWFKKVNPLITMKTKIVYRIPDEIHGEVFWRPGRNSNGTKLWMGFIQAAKSD